MAKSKPEPKGDRYARGLGPAIAALKKHIGKKSLFMPPTRRHIAMPFRELGVLLGGESNPGLPTGVFIEVLGQTGAGKTTFAMALARVVINQPDAEHRVCVDEGIEITPPPRKVLYIDHEHVLDTGYLCSAVPGIVLAQTDDRGRLLNQREANLYVHQPDTLEEGGDIMLHMIASGEFGLVINDSIAAMLGEEEREKSMGEKTMGLQAKAIGAFLRKSAHMVRRYGATVVLINQWRDKIGVSFGDPRTSPGGRAPAFWDAIRLDVFGAKKTPWFDIGKTCVIKAMKNKVTGIDGVTCEYHIGQGVGLSSEVELTQRCIAAGFIQWPGGLGRPVAFKQSGKGDKKFTSMRTWLVYLRENPEVAAAVSRKCDAAGTTRLPTVGRGGGFGDDD